MIDYPNQTTVFYRIGGLIKKHQTTYQNIVVVGSEDEDVVHSTHSSSIIEYIYLRKSYKNIPEKIIFIQLILLPE